MHAFSVADGYWASTNHMVNNEKNITWQRTNTKSSNQNTNNPSILCFLDQIISANIVLHGKSCGKTNLPCQGR